MVDVKAHYRKIEVNKGFERKAPLLQQVADMYDLTDQQIDSLKALFYKRFPEEYDFSYMTEWGRRLHEGRAYASADRNTSKVLHDSGLKEYVVVGYMRESGKVFDNYGTFSDRESAVRRYNTLKEASDRMNMDFKIEDGYKVWSKFR